MNELLALVDEDTAAFNKIMDVFSMPKGTEEEKAARVAAMEAATLYATEVPLRTLKTSFKVFEVAEAMASMGNPNSVSDAGVAAIAARGAVFGARLNVHINAEGLKDRAKSEQLMKEADEVMACAVEEEKKVLEIVENKIKG